MEKINVKNSELDMLPYSTQYSESRLKKKIVKTSQKAGISVIYYVILLWLVLKSNTSSAVDKALIIASLGYFISPVDFLPDLLPLGFTDDLLALQFVIYKIKQNLTLDILVTASGMTHKVFPSINNEEFERIVKNLITI